MSIQVAVRVRPFIKRELELKSQLCIEMKDQTTILQSDDFHKTRQFTFDHSFWSHDGFCVSESGVFIATGEKYDDQKKVFKKLGLQVLENAWAGYNCCLFAYGQTGSGKSYSMIGYGPNKGIVPEACSEIFRRISACTQAQTSYQVNLSMMELYNEKVQDLLVPINQRHKEGLKLLESTQLGFYVYDLSKHEVKSYEQIESLIELGNKNRTIGATQMNSTSSRAHTVISIEIRQTSNKEDTKSLKSSLIHLVDLAGSEKQAKSKAEGDRFKEGININKSLTQLGIVISTLAENEQKGTKKAVVPYRDSVLTKVLKNALGGNSKTVMICAISPSSDNYEETLSTLKYADQAKKIKNHAVINESVSDKKVLDLINQNEKLKLIFSLFEEKFGINLETMEDFTQLENFFKGRQKTLAQSQSENVLSVTYPEFQPSATKTEGLDSNDDSLLIESPQVADQLRVYLTNLNEDELLNHKIQYDLSKDFTYVGRKNGIFAINSFLIKLKRRKPKTLNSAIQSWYSDESCGVYQPKKPRNLFGSQRHPERKPSLCQRKTSARRDSIAPQ